MIESNAPQTTKPQNSPGASESEQIRYSVVFNKAIDDGKERIALPNPCGTTTVNNIHIALSNFFTALKGIKQYANVYITPAINAVSNITSIISQTASIIGAVLKSLMNRLRDFLIDKIRKAIESLIEMLLPTVARNIKNTVIQTIVDNLFCAFKNIIGGLADLALDFLNELVGKVVNAPFCAAQQFTNALINNVAAVVDSAVGPLLGQINNILGGVTKIVGSVFQALDYILGFEAFLCAKPNCPEINEFKASAWGGPNQAEIDAFNDFLAPAANASAEGIIGSVDDYISNIEIFGDKLGNSPQYQLPCDTSAFKCGAPKITFFGGGGAGAVGEAIVDNVGRTIGVDLVFGGSNYNRPPFVSFEDSCENTFTSGYAVIDSDKNSPKFGQVTDVVITSGGTSPPSDGRNEFGGIGDGFGDDGIFTGDITAGSSDITNVSDTTNLVPGVAVLLTGGGGTVTMPSSYTIISVSGSTVTLNDVFQGSGSADDASFSTGTGTGTDGTVGILPIGGGTGIDDGTDGTVGILPIGGGTGTDGTLIGGGTGIDDGSDRPGNDYIVCLVGFRVLNTGIGYTEEDSITLTPDVPNLNASVSMTEFGQIFDIQINEPVCGLETIPEVIINSPTGNSAVIQPIVSFTRVEDFDDASGDPDITINVGDTPIDTLRGRTVLTENLKNQGLFSRNVVRVVDCVSGSGASNYNNLVGYVNGQPYYGPFHTHPSTGVKMVGAVHTNRPHEIIYNTRRESLNSLQLGLSTQSSNTTSTTPSPAPSPAPAPSPTPAPAPAPSPTPAPAPAPAPAPSPSPSPSPGGGGGGY